MPGWPSPLGQCSTNPFHCHCGDTGQWSAFDVFETPLPLQWPKGLEIVLASQSKSCVGVKKTEKVVEDDLQEQESQHQTVQAVPIAQRRERLMAHNIPYWPVNDRLRVRLPAAV